MTSYVVRLQRLDSIPLAVIRRQARQADLARVVPECCGLVWNAVRAQQSRAGRHVAVYWDDRIRLEVGVELDGPFAEDRVVVRSATPAGVVASVTHYGPYAGLGAAHDALRGWCRANHHRLAGPSWEVYGHWQSEWNADPSLIRTDVCYLVSDGSEPVVDADGSRRPDDVPAGG
jgi:effector-binding domain-containing protein